MGDAVFYKFFLEVECAEVGHREIFPENLPNIVDFYDFYGNF